jgi:holo-[acyl-carrier protein] synthase
MIYGIGVDLVNIRRVGRVIDRLSSLALRFAAKEAFSKAIGLGMKKGIRWRDIEIVHHPSGRPDINVTGKALSFCYKQGIRRWYVTLSDEGDYGIATVVLEKSVT